MFPSAVCLILLTDFHKNASFRPGMLNYLNTTFTFGKQTDNFINRKVQCRPYILIHSLILVPAFLLWRVAGAAARGGPKYLTINRMQFQIVLLFPQQDGTKQGRRYSHATWAAFQRVQTVAERT